MKISQILASKGDHVVTIAPDATVADLVDSLALHNIGALIVSRDGRYIDGIVTERDVVRSMARSGHDEQMPDLDMAPVKSIMTAQVTTCGTDTTIENLMQMMTEGRMRHIPVLRDGIIAGIISIGDLVKHRMAELEDEREALIHYVTG